MNEKQAQAGKQPLSMPRPHFELLQSEADGPMAPPLLPPLSLPVSPSPCRAQRRGEKETTGAKRRRRMSRSTAAYSTCSCSHSPVVLVSRLVRERRWGTCTTKAVGCTTKLVFRPAEQGGGVVMILGG